MLPLYVVLFVVATFNFLDIWRTRRRMQALRTEIEQHLRAVARALDQEPC